MNFINQFEKNWSQAASRMKRFDFDKLKNKKIAVFGSDFWVRAVSLCLLSINEKKNIDIKVYCKKAPSVEDCFKNGELFEIDEADDFDIVFAERYSVFKDEENYGSVDFAKYKNAYTVLLTSVLDKDYKELLLGNVQVCVLKVGEVFCSSYNFNIANQPNDLDPVYISEVLCALVKIMALKDHKGEYVISEKEKLFEDIAVPLKDAFELTKAGAESPDEMFVFSDAKTHEFKTVQAIVFGILKAIDRVCKENNIEYFLAGGTLLGAIRHGGFIPWDYDGDVMMTRENYEKFIAVAEDSLPDMLFLQTPKSDKDNHFYTKVRLNGTVFSTEFTQKFKNLHQGIFVDIFAHDKTAKGKIGQKIHRNLTILARSLVFNKWGGTKVKGAEQDGSNKIIRGIATVLKTVLPMKFLEWFQFFIIRLYCKNKKTKYLYDGMGQNLRRGAFLKSWLDEAIYWDFEGYSFPVPKEYKKYLIWLYGDYEEIMPCSQRHISHDITKLDLGKYENFKLTDNFDKE